MADATTASLATALLGLNRKRDPLEIYNSFGKQQMAAGSSTAPLGSGNPLEGIARALQGGIGGLVQGYALNKEDEKSKATVTTLGDLYNAPDDATRAKIIQNTKGDTDIIAPIVAQLLGNKQTQQAAGATLGPLGVPPVGGGSGGVLGTPVAATPPMQQGGGAAPAGWQGGGAPAAVPQDAAPAGQRMVQTLTSQGVSPVAAAGIVGSLYQESKFNPTAVGDKGTAYGMGQWRNDRAGALGQFAQAQGKPPTDPDVQLSFLMNELKSGDMGAQRAWAMLQTAKTPEEATTAMMHFFRPEGYTPNNPQAGNGYAQRVQYAQSLLPSGGGAMPAGGPQAAPGQPGPVAAPPAQGSGPTPTPQQGAPTAMSSPAGDQLRQRAQAFAQAGNMVEAQKYAQEAAQEDAKWSVKIGEKNVDQVRDDVNYQRTVADEAARNQRSVAEEQARHQRDLQDKKDNPTYTQEQNLAHTYATRLNNAVPQLEALIKDPSKIPSWNEQLQANSPYYPEALVSDKAKEFRRITKDIMSSTLRRESGASIHNDEYTTEAQKFIPQPGDPPEVVANKLAALKQAGRSIAEGTGRPVTTYGVFGAQPPAGSGAGGPAQGGGGIPDPPPGFRPIR